MLGRVLISDGSTNAAIAVSAMTFNNTTNTLSVTGTTEIIGELIYSGQSNIYTTKITGVSSSQVIASIPISTYTGFIIYYTVNDEIAVGARISQIFTAFIGGYLSYIEPFVGPDLYGTYYQVDLIPQLNGSNVELYANVSNSTWTISYYVVTI